MDQTAARELAREIRATGRIAVATQASRHAGQWPSPGEAWVVVVSGVQLDSRRLAVQLGCLS
jgi:hypothetical protein